MVVRPSPEAAGSGSGSGSGAVRGADLGGGVEVVARWSPLTTCSENPSVSILNSDRSDSSMIRRISLTSSSDSGMRSVAPGRRAEGIHDQRQRRLGLGLLGLLLGHRGDRPRLDHEQLAVGVAGERPLDVLMAAEVALDVPGD